MLAHLKIPRSSCAGSDYDESNATEEVIVGGNNYGFAAETTGLERTAATLKDDSKDFLSILATFLPHGYLTDKLVTTTTSFENAFAVIEEHFGLQATQESLLDLESLNKQSGESYRQFYERLLAHVRQHMLTTAAVSVDGATVPDGGDKLTVSHMNLVALMWLRKIHPELINLVAAAQTCPAYALR